MKISSSLGSGRVQWLGAAQRSTPENIGISVYQNKIKVTGSECAVSQLNRMGRVHTCYCNLRTKAFFPFIYLEPEALPIPNYNIEMQRA